MSKFTKPQRLFGVYVREVRAKQGWTQDEMAHRCDLNRVYMGEVERGEKTVSLETVVKIAKAFGLTGGQLLSKAGI